MGTRSELRNAGVVAVLTAVLLGVALALLGGGPRSPHPEAVLAWHESNTLAVKAGMVTWLLAMLGLVAFAVSFREALWSAVVDRPWMTVLFQQGAVVFATVAVAYAAIGWALADLAAAGVVGADLAATVWAVSSTLLRFATWGFTVPLAVAGLVLFRHSALGQVCALAALLLALALIVPLTWQVALHVFPVWLLLTGVALVAGSVRHVRQPALRT